MKSKNIEYLTKLFAIWCTSDYKKREPMIVTDDETDFISKIIYKRTEMFNIKIPLELAYIISICSGGNPGFAIIIYYTMLKKIVSITGKIPNGYIIKPMDFSIAFADSFPDITNPDQNDKFQKLWNEQKDEKGRNKVDRIDYWKQLFE